MIRSTLRRVVRRLLGRRPAPTAAPPRRTAPRPPEQDHAHDHAHDHGHTHDHGHDHEEEPDLEVDGETLAAWLGEDGPVLLDVREPNELLAGHAEGALLVPMNQVPHRLAEIPKGRRVVVYCAAGGRSYGVAGFLREHGWPEAYSLAGGFGEYVSHGGKWLRPPFQAKHPIASRVRITRDPLDVDGVAVPQDHRTGTVQEIRETDAGVRYAVGLADEAGMPFVVRDLAEDELARG